MNSVSFAEAFNSFLVKTDLFYKGSLFLSKSKVKKIVVASFANCLNTALGQVRTS